MPTSRKRTRQEKYDTALLYNYTGLTPESLARLKVLVDAGDVGIAWQTLFDGCWFGLRHTFSDQGYVRANGDLRIATPRAREVVERYGHLAAAA